MDERVVVTREPLNAETRLDLQEGALTATGGHYVRSHFAFPVAPDAIAFGGAVRAGRTVTLEELRALPSRTLTVTLECAGNGRAYLEPPAPGEQWRLGAVSTAEWTGVPLSALLEPCGLSSGVVEILFRGADRGTVKDLGREIAFERSLPLSRALAEDVIVAHAMNGGPLPQEHGAPLRLVVPSWYGMASVKWLAEVVALEEPFRGFFQADRYVVGDTPIREMHPRAVISWPAEGERVAASRLNVRGFAWSGNSPVVAVEFSPDGGRGWVETELGPTISTFSWREWRIDWKPKRTGVTSLRARAVTADGRRQPETQVRTELGYCNTAVQETTIELTREKPLRV